MTNCAMDVKGNILTITVDLSKRYGPSKSGKTVTVATTSGNIAAPEHPDVKIGLNVYAKGEEKQ
jgi:hypothetical protein